MSLLSRVSKYPVVGAMVRVLCAIARAACVVFTKPLRVLGYLYVMRVAALVALVIIAMPLLSWIGPLRSLTVGAYEVTHWMQALVATVIFALASGSVYAMAAAFAQGIGKRYRGHVFAISPMALRWWRIFVVLSVLGNTLWMIAASWDSVSHPFGETDGIILRKGSILGLFGGVFGASLVVLLVGGATWLQARLFRPFHTRMESLGLGKPYHWFAYGGAVGALERWIQHHQTPQKSGLLARLYHNLGARAGVVRKENGHIMLEHGQARIHAYAILTTLVYVVLIWITPLAESIAPVSAIFMLLVVVTYVGSGLTYLLDHYRVPLIMFVVAYCGFMTQWRESDHFYPIYPKDKPRSLDASGAPEILTQTSVQAAILEGGQPEKIDVQLGENLYRRLDGKTPLGLPAQLLGLDGREKKTVVVVALAGGGIQAAAWPLAALEKISNRIPEFHNHVRLISGVSGGSVGALYYAHAYSFQENGKLPVKRARQAAEESSLAKVTLAILRDDLRKIAAPITAGEKGGKVLRDRGFALEETLDRNAATYFDPAGDSALMLRNTTLTSWGKDALQRLRPALVFNGTVVETGERISFSTVPRNTPQLPGTVEFSRRYHAELAMPTAARLSATFPIVSPAARPAASNRDQSWVDVIPGRYHWDTFPDGCSYLHVVDGGYFEVSGVVGALAWLGEAMEQLKDIHLYEAPDGTCACQFFKMPERIIFIQVSGFPVPPPNACVDEGGNTAGTLFDAISPVVAAIGIRNGVQASFPDELIRLFKNRWENNRIQPVQFFHVPLKPVIDPAEWDKRPWTNSGFLPQSPPLSWHLRLCEKEELEKQVHSGLEKEIEELKTLLSTPP